jgi:flagellar L-ring protein precursor FlgH
MFAMPKFMTIRRLGGGVAALCLVALGGCASLHQTPEVDLAESPPIDWRKQAQQAAAMQRPASGGLFQAASYRPGFEDPRARLVGDSLTIQIVESVSASQKSTSNVSKTGKVDASITSLPLLGAGSSLLGKLGTGADSTNEFAGTGDTANNQTFTGTITTTVMEVLPNGHLLVVGEKQIGVNQNVDVLRFSGTVDPRHVRPGNVVASSQVANARILSRGRGQQADAQQIGWLSRVFLSILPF